MSPSDSTPPPGPTTPLPPGDAATKAERLPPSNRLWSFALGAGLVGGLLAWLAGEVAILFVKPETEMLNAMGVMVEAVSRQGEIRADQMKAHLSFGLMGAMFGLALGLGGGLARRAARQGLIAGLTALVVGGIAATAASLVLVPVYQAYRDADPLSTDLMVPMLIHGGVWILVGAAGGLAFGLGLGGGKGRITNAVVGGLIGAALGTVAFEIVGALAFPLANTHKPVSDSWASRLVARLLVAVLAAAGIGAMLTRQGARRPAAAPPASPPTP